MKIMTVIIAAILISLTSQANAEQRINRVKGTETTVDSQVGVVGAHGTFGNINRPRDFNYKSSYYESVRIKRSGPITTTEIYARSRQSYIDEADHARSFNNATHGLRQLCGDIGNKLGINRDPCTGGQRYNR